MVIVPNVAKDAQPVLDQLRAQRTHCTLFVLKGGDAGSQLASQADIRSENHPFRKVAWVATPSVLSIVQGYTDVIASAGNGDAICVMTFDFRLSSTLTGSPDLLDIEQAFIKAEGAS